MAAQYDSTLGRTKAPRDYLRVCIYVGGYFVCADAPAEQMEALDGWICKDNLNLCTHIPKPYPKE